MFLATPSLGRRPLLARLLAASALAAALPWPARARDDAGIRLDYALSRSGLDVAALTLAVADDGDALRSELVMRSRGIAALTSGAWSRLTARTHVEGERVMPLGFDAYHFKRDRVREVAIAYGPDGEITDLVVTSNGREKDSDVPPPLRAGTVDPLTAFHRLRVWFCGVVAGETDERRALVPVFDGRKRYDVEAEYGGPTRWRERPAHVVLVRLIAHVGFEPEDRFMTFPGEEEGERLRVVVPGEQPYGPGLVVPQRDRNARIELVGRCERATC